MHYLIKILGDGLTHVTNGKKTTLCGYNDLSLHQYELKHSFAELDALLCKKCQNIVDELEIELELDAQVTINTKVDALKRYGNSHVLMTCITQELPRVVLAVDEALEYSNTQLFDSFENTKTKIVPLSGENKIEISFQAKDRIVRFIVDNEKLAYFSEHIRKSAFYGLEERRN